MIGYLRTYLCFFKQNIDGVSQKFNYYLIQKILIVRCLILCYKNMSAKSGKKHILHIWNKMVSIVNKDLYINKNNIT